MKKFQSFYEPANKILALFISLSRVGSDEPSYRQVSPPVLPSQHSVRLLSALLRNTMQIIFASGL